MAKQPALAIQSSLRRNTVFAPLLESFRRMALAVAALLLSLAGVAAMALMSVRQIDPVPVLCGAGLLAAALGVLTIGYRRMLRNVTEAIKHTGDVMASVHRDALTGVFTRSYFMEELRNHVYHGANKAVGYIHLDMDNLKQLNDGSGHGAGDAALVHLAQCIQQVMPGAIIGRLGGDEFGIAVTGCDNRGALRRLGEELLRQLDKPVPIVGRMTRLSATLGLALAPADAVEVDDLISKADLALYQGKRAGRHRVVSFSADMLGDERHRRFVERELRAALLMDELELHYQPVVDADQKLRSHEALVRWRHKVRGMIPPGQFITIAEESDLIDKLGDWVLKRACADVDKLGTPVAVNVSPAQLRRAEFADELAAIVTAAAIDPKLLIVEITETVPLVAGAVESTNLAQIRALGVRVAIDDFGAGHASLQYLRGFTFDIIKIDRTYISSLGQNRIDAMIVRAICDIARSLPVDVVAEGVETQEQFDILRAAGCTAFQGYFLGVPAPLKQRAAANAA